jgi:GT2 family glycosyltransferase
MLNQDIILEPNFLEVIVKFLDAHPDVGAVTGKLLRWDFLNNKKTNQLDSAGLKIFKNHRVVELGAGQTDSDKWNISQEVFGVSGAAPIYRRKALEDVAIPRSSTLRSAFFRVAQQSRTNDPLADEREYFDVDFFSYKEDVDLAYRLRLFGWRAWFLPEARAYHDRTARGSGEKNIDAARQRKSKSAFVNYHSYKNHLFFLAKDVPAGVWRRYGYRIKWYEFKKFVYLLIFESRTLGSLREFFKKLPKMRKKRKWIQKNKKVGVAEIKRWFEN